MALRNLARLAAVRAMPFTYCDAGDARVAQGIDAFVGSTGCAGTVDGLGPEAGESRYLVANRFCRSKVGRPWQAGLKPGLFGGEAVEVVGSPKRQACQGSEAAPS